jgi:predicted phage tail protein
MTKLFIDNNEITLSSYAHGVQATVGSGRYKDRLKAQFFDGRDDQTVSTLLQEAPNWTSNHRLRGLCYIALRFEWKKIETQEDADNNPYSGGIPQIRVQLQGKKILDLRTINPSTYNTAYASDTLTYDNNPVNVLVDYLRNDRYGKGLPNDVFDWTSFKSAADQCFTVVTYANADTSRAFTCDAVIDTANNIMSNCKIILAGFRGIMPYQQGKYFLKVENGGDDSDITATPASPTTVFTVTNDHIIGGMTIEGESKQHKCNRCVVTYIDPNANYEPNEVSFPEPGSSDDTTFLAQDNNIRLEKRITLPTIADRRIAEQYARVFVRRSRSEKLVSFATNLATSNTSVGDLIRVQNTHLSLDAIFRIMDMRLNTAGNVEITALEHQSGAYAIDASGTDYTRPTTSLPDPFQVIAPTNLSVQSGAAFNLQTNDEGYLTTDSTTRRLKISWTASTDPFVNEYIVQFKVSSSGSYQTAGITVDTEFFISGVALGQDYDVRVAARNELDRRSDFVEVTDHTVVA